MHDKVQALDRLARAMGLYRDRPQGFQVDVVIEEADYSMLTTAELYELYGASLRSPAEFAELKRTFALRIAARVVEKGLTPEDIQLSEQDLAQIAKEGRH